MNEFNLKNESITNCAARQKCGIIIWSTVCTLLVLATVGILARAACTAYWQKTEAGDEPMPTPSESIIAEAPIPERQNYVEPWPLVRELAVGDHIVLTGKFILFNGWPPNIRFVTEANEIVGIGTGESGDGSLDVDALLAEQRAQETMYVVTAEFIYIDSVQLHYYETPLLCFSLERILSKVEE